MNLLQQTVTDILVEQLRHEIIQGKLKPGDRLRLRDLADRFQVSTMPVREALQILATEGLVSGAARRGATVTQLSAADLEDIYELRATLEALATRLAAPHVTPALLERLRQITDELDQYEAQGEMAKIIETNERFHETLYAIAGRKHLTELISTLRHRTAHYLHLRASLSGAPLAHQDHYAIIAALQAGNPEQAATIMYDHIANAGRSIIAFLQPSM